MGGWVGLRNGWMDGYQYIYCLPPAGGRIRPQGNYYCLPPAGVLHSQNKVIKCAVGAIKGNKMSRLRRRTREGVEVRGGGRGFRDGCKGGVKGL